MPMNFIIYVNVSADVYPSIDWTLESKIVLYLILFTRTLIGVYLSFDNFDKIYLQYM